MSIVQINFNHIYKKYYNYILEDYNLEINNDQINFIIGVNGSGKTTLIKCLFNLVNYHGEIKYNKDIKLIYIPEKVFLPDFIKMIDFIQILTNKSKEEIVDYLLLFKIEQYTDVYLCNLSLGTKQKMLLITGILQKADGYVFDEPLNGLDDKSIEVFNECLIKLKEDNKLIIIISHRLNNYPNIEKRSINIGNKND